MKRIILLLFLLACGIRFTNAQWVQTNGPEGGIVGSITSLGNHLFAGTTGGLYRSDNYGTNWTLDTNFGHLDIVIAAAIDSILLVSTTGLSSNAAALYLSNDTGQTWQLFNQGIGGTYIYAFTTMGPKLFAATVGGVFMSYKGSAWSPVSNGLTNTAVHGIAAMGGNLYAGTENGLFESDDEGQNWSVMNDTLSNTIILSLTAPGDTLLAGTWSGGFRSTDGGTTWKETHNSTVSVFALNGTDIYAGDNGNGPYISTDNGVSWTKIANGMPIKHVRGFAFIGTHVFASTNDGIYISANKGALWTRIFNGLKASAPQSIIVKGSSLYTGTRSSGVFVTNDTGYTWTSKNNGLYSTYIYCMIADGSVFYAGHDVGGIYKSTDSAATWTATNSGKGPVYAMAVNNNKLYAAMYDGFYISADSGTSWTRTDSGIATNARPASLFAFNGKMYAGTYGGAFVTEDDGISWNRLSGMDTAQLIYAFGAAGNRFITSGSKGLYISSDNGITWTIVNDPAIKNIQITCFASKGSYLFGGTAYGVFKSLDSGSTWQTFDAGMGSIEISCLETGGDIIYAGAYGAGIWKRPLSDILLPAETLFPDYGFFIFPNPSMNSLTIRSSAINKSEVLALSILNLEGEMVQEEQLKWDGEPAINISHLTPGIYFLQIKSESGVVNRKFVKE